LTAGWSADRLCDRSVAESPVSALAATSRAKTTADEVPKKKDGRGRPRKDRTLELAKPTAAAAAAAVGSAVVRSIAAALLLLSFMAVCCLYTVHTHTRLTALCPGLPR